MKRDPKTMLKAAVALGVALAAAYFTVPAARAFILASAPILLALICPVAMLAMMYFMKGAHGGKPDEDAKPSPNRPEAGPEQLGRGKP